MAHRIVLEKRFNKMIDELNLAMKASSQMLHEAGLPTGIDQGILKASKAVEKSGEDVADQNVQAAMLLAALQKNGDVSRVSADDVSAAMTKNVKESKQSLKESESAIIHIIEMVALVLGNAALIETICEIILKITGKKVDPTKFKAAVTKFATFLKKATGLPMKAFGNAIAWIIKKMGGGDASQKIGKYSVKLVVVVVMAAMGVLFFPLGGVSLVGIALSITGMIGKGFEIVKLAKELTAAIKKAAGSSGGSSPAPALA